MAAGVDRVWFAIDPGTTKSGWVIWSRSRGVIKKGIDDNGVVVERLDGNTFDVCAIERFEARGMAVGVDSLETVWWSGKFAAHVEHLSPRARVVRPTRREIKVHLCGTVRARDSNVRQALLDRYGSTRQRAIGTKAKPGPLHGVSSHVWAALAVAVTASDLDVFTPSDRCVNIKRV